MSDSIFPGHLALLKTPGVIVTATPGGVSRVEREIGGGLHWMDKGPEYVERHIATHYARDPTVLWLLELYLEADKRLEDCGQSVMDEDDLPGGWPGPPH